jgi:5'-nucleotidase
MNIAFENDSRPLILVTNDDGIEARGIAALCNALRGLGRIIVVAPDGPRSGHACSFTCTRPLELRLLSDDGDVARLTVSGTPVDCVKLAFHRIFPKRRPDLLVSGINHGANSSICVVYSGTMGAAIEGCIVGVPAIGFSLCDHRPDADFTTATAYVRRIAQQVLTHGLERGICLNVNIPSGGSIQGVRVARQADGYWTREFDHIEDQPDCEVYRVTGEYANREPEAADTDEYLLARGYVTVVPTQVDLTAHRRLESVRFLEQ